MVNERVVYTVKPAEVKTKRNEKGMMIGALGRMHLHSEVELILVTSGALAFHVEQKVCFLREGDVLVINDRVPHYGEVIEANSAFDMVQLRISREGEEVKQQLWRFLSEDAWSCLSFPAESTDAQFISERIRHLISSAYRCHKALVYDEMACKYELLAFLYENGYLSEIGERLLHEKTGAILRILNIIDDRYAEDLTLAEIAEQVHMSRAYICRLFKRLTGRTVVDYLNFVRVTKAESLLRAGSSVTEAAAASGFDDPAYFGKVFKKYLFFTSTEYKKRICSSNEIRLPF